MLLCRAGTPNHRVALCIEAGRGGLSRARFDEAPKTAITHFSQFAAHCAACKLRSFVARLGMDLAWMRRGAVPANFEAAGFHAR
jgi:hypothetical protein